MRILNDTNNPCHQILRHTTPILLETTCVSLLLRCTIYNHLPSAFQQNHSKDTSRILEGTFRIRNILDAIPFPLSEDASRNMLEMWKVVPQFQQRVRVSMWISGSCPRDAPRRSLVFFSSPCYQRISTFELYVDVLFVQQIVLEWSVILHAFP